MAFTLDLVLPVKTHTKIGVKVSCTKNTRGGDTTFNYVAFGWGDKGFLSRNATLSPDLKVSTAFKAGFGLSTSAVHATFYNNLREGERCVRLDDRWGSNTSDLVTFH